MNNAYWMDTRIRALRFEKSINHLRGNEANINMVFTDYLSPIIRVVSAELADVELLAGLLHAPSGRFRQVEAKLKVAALNNGIPSDIVGYTSKLLQEFSPLATKHLVFLDEYAGRVKSIHDFAQHRLGSESWEWADFMLNKHPELAVRICSLPDNAREIQWLTCAAVQGLDMNHYGRKSWGESVTDKVSSLERRLVPKAVKAGYKPSSIDFALLVIEDVYGNIRAPMRFALALFFQNAFLYATSILLGREDAQFNPDAKAYTREEFECYEAVALRASFTKELGTEAFMATLMTGASADRTRKENLKIRERVIASAQAIDVMVASQEEAAAHYKREIENLRQGLSAAETKVCQLEDELANDSRTRQLRTEQEDLSAEVAEVYLQLWRREQKIVRLESRIRELATALQRRVTDIPEFSHDTATTQSFTAEDDLAALEAVKGVVVGGHPTFISKLKLLLPTWSFYAGEDKTTDDDVVKGADLVVLWTNYCSHTLTNPVSKLIRKHGIPVCYSEKSNTPTFINEVASFVRQGNIIQSGSVVKSAPGG